MARTKKQTVLLHPLAKQNVKAQFLNAVKEVCPMALRPLEEEINRGELSVPQWAEQFNVQDTWIEHWASEVIESWRSDPGSYPFWPIPADQSGDSGFSYSVHNARPFPLASRSVSPGRSCPGGIEKDDWENFKKQQHENLERALEGYRERLLLSGAGAEVVMPDDFEQRLAVAALYIFEGLTAAEIGKHPKVTRDSSVVSRWLREVLELLELRPRAPGHRR